VGLAGWFSFKLPSVWWVSWNSPQVSLLTVRRLQNWTMQLRVFPLRFRLESFLNLNWSFESKFL